MSRTAAKVDRTRPPEPGPIQTYRFPEFTRHRLDSGLEVIPARLSGAPLVELQLLFPAGADRDPAERPGLASLVSELLDEGTENRSALEIASSVERLGGRLDTGTDWNVSSAAVHVLAEDLDEGLDLLAEVATRPTFPADEVERARRNRLTDLLRRHDRPAVLAKDHFDRMVYGSSAYGRPLAGAPEAVRAIDRDDVQSFYRRHFRIGAATLLATGDLEPDALVEAARRRFGAAEPGPAPAASRPEAPAPDRVRVRVIDRPGSPQTELRLGHAAIPRHHPDWTALGVLNALFGGKFTSRVNMVLRERHGVTYGVSSRVVPRLGPGPFLVSTAVANDGAGLAVREILAELGRLRREPVDDEELADAKSYLLGLFPYTLQTLDGIQYHLENLVVYDLPDDHYAPERYLARMEAVDRDEILRVARAHLRPDRAAVVAVGPAAELVPQLEGLGDLEVVGPEAG